MDAFWQFLSAVIVAGMGVITVVIQTRNKNKLDNQKTLLDTVNANIAAMRKESKDDDEKLSKKLDTHELASLKRFLVDELAKIKNGVYIPTDNQKSLIHEAKKEYNDLGGDSYVDEMFDDLVEKGLI